ncbi:MAG: phytoene desaturase [Polyangiaceae bacterium]|nr:phytoene desaturase [Polyangiaceae bacterium]
MSERRTKRAAVVGSGFGGLATAIRLQAAGIHTTIFEARDKPGGRAYVYQDSGFTFDAGPTVITAPHCIDELFELAGRRRADYVELLPVLPFYRLVWSDGDSLDYAGGDVLERQIRERSPDDVEGYRRFLDYSRRVFEKGYQELVATPFLRFWDMMKVAPDLAALRADRSVYSAVSRYVQDPHLREALSFHALLVGGNPFDTSSIYTLIHHLEREWGVYFPRGGTGALVQALVRLFEDLGGRLHLSSPVERIELTARAPAPVHRVHARGQAPADFDLVVSNADIHHTYDRLYAGVKGAAARARKLEQADWSMSLFVLYFGTDRQYDVAHHTVLFGPRYEGLLRDIFGGSSSLAEDFSLYLHAPTVTDPSLAPEGHAAFYVLSPVPHLGHAPLDWATEAPRYAERILASLERVLPDVRRHVVVKRWMTPLDFQSELNAYQGSAFSVAPKLTQSAWFRPHNRDDRIPGLYVAGAGTHPGAGLPGVINSGKATARVILEDLGHVPQRSAAGAPIPTSAGAVTT